MISIKKIATALLVLGAWLMPVSQATAAAPAWKLVGIHLPTNFSPGEEGVVMLVADNIGGKATAGTLTLTDILPAELHPIIDKTESIDNDPSGEPEECQVSGQEVTCVNKDTISPGRQWEVMIHVNVDPLALAGILPDEATLSGGSAPITTVDTTTTIGSKPGSGTTSDSSRRTPTRHPRPSAPRHGG